MAHSPIPNPALAARHGALVHQLGGAACVLPIPSHLDQGLFEVGILGGIPVWSCEASPRETAALARRLSRRGQLGLLVAGSPDGQRIGLAVTIQPLRVISLHTDRTVELLVRRLRRCSETRDSQLASAIALTEAIDLDEAGRRTFRMLHALVARGIALLPAHVPEADRHGWVLTQLTRLLFLRFVEAEGWLDGETRFLATQFERCLERRRDPTRQLLQPLFFGTLNRPVVERSRLARGFGRIPFLNGGLFEPHPIERRWSLRLPVDYWRDAFAALVDRVEVTLDHESADGRVTPELLGRVFEGVMESGERRQEGAFFTPPELVDVLVREAIGCHLAATMHRTEAQVIGALADPDPALLAAMLDLHVLDPAAGSGAFLVGALSVLHGPGARDPVRVGHLVTRQLFGVDRHPGAVRLAELRLWLEVLRAHRGAPPHELPPLPNLDTTIRAGDALLDPVLTRGLRPAEASLLAVRQQAVMMSHGAERRRAATALAEAEVAAAVGELRGREERLAHRIADLIAAERAPTLFGERAAPSISARRALRSLRQERARLRVERRRLSRASASGAFAMSVAFAPLLAQRDGFDLILGNPPWVRAERLAPQVREQLSRRYRWWQSGGSSGWHHLPDLAVAFVERSAQLLRPGGTFALLVPSKLATAGYGSAMRAGLGASFTLHRVADLSNDPRAAFDATTYPLAIVATRTLPPAQHQVQLGLGDHRIRVPQAELQGAAVWSTSAPEAHRLLARLRARIPALAESVVAHLGLKTGANDVFLNPPGALHQFVRRAIRGRHVTPFHVSSEDTLLWPADDAGQPWPVLPKLVDEYLREFKVRLEQRADMQRGPWWQLFRTTGATAPHRVIWGDLALDLRAARLRDPLQVPLNSCYVAALPTPLAADALTAWLNSRWIGALARMVAEPASGGCARFAARAVGAVPMPPTILDNRTLAAFTLAAGNGDTSAALDRHVAECLELDRHDQRILHDYALGAR